MELRHDDTRHFLRKSWRMSSDARAEMINEVAAYIETYAATSTHATERNLVKKAIKAYRSNLLAEVAALDAITDDMDFSEVVQEHTRKLEREALR